VVFGTAPDALAAAIAAQGALAAESWPGSERVRARIGIHTGNATVVGDAYVGMDVHRAARIAACAHGGQIVLSAATAELVAAALPKGASLVDLGTHKLKDLPRPERLFQVATPELQRRFPPLRSLGNASSLPESPTPIVGRDRELEDLVAAFNPPGSRIVTLTGPVARVRPAWRLRSPADWRPVTRSSLSARARASTNTSSLASSISPPAKWSRATTIRRWP
jgi:hypothetical protein